MRERPSHREEGKIFISGREYWQVVQEIELHARADDQSSEDGRDQKADMQPVTFAWRRPLGDRQCVIVL